ncbi:hypothetical protein, partial [Pelagibius litoralis]|uniref:hypothetical protein n=1 Tax=Pelagibius litoralis TaxID=374515 RepID=UPI00197D58A2
YITNTRTSKGPSAKTPKPQTIQAQQQARRPRIPSIINNVKQQARTKRAQKRPVEQSPASPLSKKQKLGRTLYR